MAQYCKLLGSTPAPASPPFSPSTSATPLPDPEPPTELSAPLTAYYTHFHPPLVILHLCLARLLARLFTKPVARGGGPVAL
eukprot:2656842-Rhodomonas_salina.1